MLLVYLNTLSVDIPVKDLIYRYCDSYSEKHWVSNSAIEGCLALLISVAWCWSTVEHWMKGSFVWCTSAKKPSLCCVNNMVGHTVREGASLGKLERVELQFTKRFFFLCLP